MNSTDYKNLCRSMQKEVDRATAKASERLAESAQNQLEKEVVPMRSADTLEDLHKLLSAEIKASKKDSHVNRIIAVSSLIVGILTLIATIAGLIATLN